MHQPIPATGLKRLKAGDRVQIAPEWQDPGDDLFERFVIDAPDNYPRVLIQTLIPGFSIQPLEWIDAAKLVLLPPPPITPNQQPITLSTDTP